MYSCIIIKELKKQGRSKKWISNELEMTYKTFRIKLLENKFKKSEKFYINYLLNIKED